MKDTTPIHVLILGLQKVYKGIIIQSRFDR